MIIVLCIAE